MGIRGRISFGFATTLLMLLVVACTAVVSFRSLGNSVADLSAVAFTRVAASYNLEQQANLAVQAAQSWIASDKPETKAEFQKAVAAMRSNLDRMPQGDSASGVKEARSLIQQFEAIVAQGAAAAADSRKQIGILKQKSHAATWLAQEFASTAEQDLSGLMVKTPEEKEKAYLASQNAGKVERGILASQVAELSFMIERQPAMLNQLKQQFEDLDALFGEMESGSSDDVQILKIKALRKATGAYTTALNNWVKNDAVLVKVRADIGKVQDRLISFAHTLAENAEKEGTQTASAASAFIQSSTWRLIVISGVASILTVLMALAIAHNLVRSVAGMTVAMRELAGGAVDAEVPSLGRRDEIGTMAKALLFFKEEMIRSNALAEERQREQEAKARRAAKIEESIQEFKDTIGAIVADVASSADAMKAAAQSMTNTASETLEKSNLVVNSARSALDEADLVARAANQLAASIEDIGGKVEHSTQVASNAANEISRVDAMAANLSAVSTQIGEIVELISRVAKQTNLVALNASIEAERYGDEGLGFKIVAKEVKALANETAEATEKISTQIESVQRAASGVTAEINSISEKVSIMNNVSSSVFEAVGDQKTSTHEIAKSAAEVSASNGSVLEIITTVGASATRTGSVAEEVLFASGDLSRHAKTLREIVDGFVAKISMA
jgi:methyl-accepting chemotaxis protein